MCHPQDSPVFQLQVTFAALQESTQNVFNPTRLVESLKLRATEQQDAQEYVITYYHRNLFLKTANFQVFQTVHVSS
jgi:ubiquitin carboxyl-terminal hydrolase 48